MMKKLMTLVAMVGLMLGVNAAVAITVDGVLGTGEWGASEIFADATTDGPGEAEILRWGFSYPSYIQNPANPVYACIEMDKDVSIYASGSNDAWPGLWIDLDHYAGTVTYEWACYRMTRPEGGGGGPDYNWCYRATSASTIPATWVGPEWLGATPHQGIDVNAELGINTAHWGEGWNYWGWNDVIGNIDKTIGGTGSTWAYSGQIIEFAINIDDILGAVKSMPDYQNGNFKPGPGTLTQINGLWKVAARMEASTNNGGAWGVDVCEEQYVALIGDFNNSGHVNLDDFSALSTNFTGAGTTYTKTWEQGDSDQDGDVDLDDYSFLSVTFLADIDGPGGSGQTPEPVTLALLGLGGLFLRRRR
jgi:MYXO-CTERM domain-containing protein